MFGLSDAELRVRRAVIILDVLDDNFLTGPHCRITDYREPKAGHLGGGDRVWEIQLLVTGDLPRKGLEARQIGRTIELSGSDVVVTDWRTEEDLPVDDEKLGIGPLRDLLHDSQDLFRAENRIMHRGARQIIDLRRRVQAIRRKFRVREDSGGRVRIGDVAREV